MRSHRRAAAQGEGAGALIDAALPAAGGGMEDAEAFKRGLRAKLAARTSGS